jgi:hypothetical protein
MLSSLLRKLVLLVALAFWLLAPGATASASPTGIMFVPLDNRPVCCDYPAAVLQAAGYKIYMPPEKLLAGRNTPADTEALWKWLEKKVDNCKAAVISTDALIYGGLVASRTHQLTETELTARVSRLENLPLDKNIKVYAFSTLMRTPVSSFGNVEPEYYSRLGPAIYKYSGLADEIDANDASFRDELISRAIERDIDRIPLSDWLTRRDKNMTVNRSLAQMARQGRFHYFAIGKDDNAPLSHTHMEARKLSMNNMDVPDRDFQILPGVDQLGLLLLTRAVNELEGTSPRIYLKYVEGVGEDTIPQYSDQPLSKSVPQQIIAAGGQLAGSLMDSDVVLALNTPPNGEMEDSTSNSNMYFASPANRRYLTSLKQILDQGHKVSLADVAYSNGADNGFMNELAIRGLLERLVAYNGWNTADNAIGFAIAQGMLAPKIKDRDRLQLLRERVIDDWFYQSNARRTVTDQLEKAHLSGAKYNLNTNLRMVQQNTNQICQNMALHYDLTRRTTFNITFPWNRLFEINVANMKTKKAPGRNN